MTSPAKVEPREAVISADAVEISLSSGGRVLLDMGSDLTKLSADVADFLKSPEVAKKNDFWSALATLDVRTAHKIFYTFKNQE